MVDKVYDDGPIAVFGLRGEKCVFLAVSKSSLLPGKSLVYHRFRVVSGGLLVTREKTTLGGLEMIQFFHSGGFVTLLFFSSIVVTTMYIMYLKTRNPYKVVYHEETKEYGVSLYFIDQKSGLGAKRKAGA